MRFNVTQRVLEKLKEEHGVEVYEVEEALEDSQLVRRRAGGSKRLKEIKYKYVARTRLGRLLQIYLVLKPGGVWLMSAYDGDRSDQKPIILVNEHKDTKPPRPEATSHHL